jgi:hypothetical protein
MKKILACYCIIILLTGSAFARLGETLNECQTRYGVMIGTDMSRPDYPAYVFRKDGVEIRVRLYDGKSAQEIFFGITAELSFEQMRQIDGANFSPEVKAHSEIYNPNIEADVKRLLSLGVKTIQIEQYKAAPQGINGETGQGEVLSITTYEFRKIFAGTTGF